MKRLLLVMSFGIVLSSSAGCVWKHQYDALEREHNQIKAQLADVTHQSSAQNASMSGALQTAQGHLTALVAERDALRNELSNSQRSLADIRGRVEQMWTIMQTIMSTLAPVGSFQTASPGTPPSLPTPPRHY